MASALEERQKGRGRERGDEGGREGDVQSKNERELKAKVKKPWKEKKKTLLSRCGDLRGLYEKGDFCFPL